METQELIASVLCGDAVATRALVLRLLPVIRARVRRRLGARRQLGSLQARDLVQEVWLVLVKDGFAQLRSWDPARGATLEGYVSMVVDREIANRHAQVHAKKRAGQDQQHAEIDELADFALSPECMAVDLTSAHALWEHLARSLPTRGKEVLVCLCLEHKSPEEVAGSLGVDRQVVYNWRHEIRRRARKYMLDTNQSRSLQRKSMEPQ